MGGLVSAGSVPGTSQSRSVLTQTDMIDMIDGGMLA
jgi:hypothetical protein